MPNKTDYSLIVEWDIRTWSRAVRFWEQVVKRENPILGKGIELGARRGGLAYYFAERFGSAMACSDVEPIPDDTRKRLASLGLSNLISYDIADASSLPYPDETFDFVTFKSILGVVGARQRYDKIEQAIQEIHRVLRPGGLLLFAENLQGSILHRKARHWFVPWGRSWRYLTLDEMRSLLSAFARYELHATGFLSAFAPGSEPLKSSLATIDACLPFIPEKWRYVGYGVAWKEGARAICIENY